MTFWEEPERYLAVVDDFLRRPDVAVVTEIPDELRFRGIAPPSPPTAFASPSTRPSRGAVATSRDGSSGAANGMIAARSPCGCAGLAAWIDIAPAAGRAQAPAQLDDLRGHPQPRRPHLARRGGVQEVAELGRSTSQLAALRLRPARRAATSPRGDLRRFPLDGGGASPTAAWR
jgi:hypothetical protein